ncbi:MAG TPA: DUF6474 family protein [Pseudonocardiaceae bacterium]|jgi:hypothetical protein|nr:DUF6474 family protein [Pseudonocardiaceae bacterium]
MALGRKRGKGGGGLTPGSAKNMVGVAKVLGPAVLPVVAPYALKAASAARDGLDRYRARRLGVDVGRLAEYSGRGGALHARIVGADQSLADLEGREGAADADREFAVRSRATLTKLAAAVRAAERMPVARRKAAHKAVAAGLDPIEQGLLQRFGL